MSDLIATEMTRALSTTLGSSAKELGQVIADKVRFLRWKSAVRTLEKAKEFAEPYGGLKNIPPLKFFLPFMETCSLEEDDEDVVAMWANLLVSASIEFKSGHLLFMRLLRELTGSEARLLRDIAQGQSPTPVSRWDIESGIRYWGDFFSSSSPLLGFDLSDWVAVSDLLLSALHQPGMAVEDFALYRAGAHPKDSIERRIGSRTIFESHERISLDILTSLNLVRRVTQSFHDKKRKFELEATAICMTAMGAEFYLECSPEHQIPLDY